MNGNINIKDIGTQCGNEGEQYMRKTRSPHRLSRQLIKSASQ